MGAAYMQPHQNTVMVMTRAARCFTAIALECMLEEKPVCVRIEAKSPLFYSSYSGKASLNRVWWPVSLIRVRSSFTCTGNSVSVTHQREGQSNLMCQYLLSRLCVNIIICSPVMGDLFDLHITET